ncbi:MAG: ACP S-malonyltransferase [Lachnospiraceae bacterium]|jgi:[acyl-carrier-protein] S-malonyltransferase|nr:ACP S-malonyltransferase [Lachnospiraceae bacterium]MCI9108641.1 ACP S-malonyltransferase [Lachnospiraceae bacterium]MCI9342187.1 ACP S-malonyltransferase [Lachnospiraceae bacterium]
MGKTAFIFPGQGAQYIGMGRDFYEQVPVSREMFDLASKAANLDVAALCFEENEKINITEYTQIAMLAMEAAVLKAVEEKGFKPDMAAGLSLGEYGALVAAGVMSEEDAFRVVRKRGMYMQEAVPKGGAMTAVLGLGADAIEKVCEETEGIVSIANYNCPGQIVITGQADAVNKAAQTLSEAGAKRCIPLNVSGPFHSIMLKEAGEKLGEVLEETEIHDIRLPYLANVTADYVADKEQVKPLLMQQIASPVRWQQSVERMIADGVDNFVEIGPGKTLSGFMRKINRDVKVINIEKVEDLKKLDGIR